MVVPVILRTAIALPIGIISFMRGGRCVLGVVVLRARVRADGNSLRQIELIVCCFAGGFIYTQNALDRKLVSVQPVLELLPLLIDHLECAYISSCR